MSQHDTSEQATTTTTESAPGSTKSGTNPIIAEEVYNEAKGRLSKCGAMDSQHKALDDAYQKWKTASLTSEATEEAESLANVARPIILFYPAT